MGKIKGINHITLICKDLKKSCEIFIQLFEAKEIYSSNQKEFSISPEKFFLVGDLWIALMEGPSLVPSYNHIAFSVEADDFPFFKEKIKELGLEEKPSRLRNPEEGESLYFYDYDGHLFELNTGNLNRRMKYYKEFSQREI